MDRHEFMQIKDAEVLHGYRVRLLFQNGVWKTVDLEEYLHGPIFEPLRQDRELFRTVKADEELGTIVWPNGADLDPDVLYYDDLQPAWMDDTTNETIAEHDGSSRWRARRRWGSPVGLRWRRSHGAGAQRVDPADVVGDRVVHQQALPHLGPQHGQGGELGRRHPEVRGILEW